MTQLRGSKVSPHPDSAVQPPMSEVPHLASVLQYRDVFLLPNVNIRNVKAGVGLAPPEPSAGPLL